MNVIDSSGWLEYFADGPNASFFSNAIESTKELFVPTLSIYEVFKKILQQKNESDALQVIAIMQQGQIINLDAIIAVHAARISIDKQLPLADSIMLSTSILYNAIFWTQDAHFANIENIKYKKTEK
jgi:predicted nucleic acid-binding protein